MLNDERTLQDSLNAAGQIAMGPMLEQFDTKGEPIRVGHVKHTVKAVPYTHLRAHETPLHLVCRLLLEKKIRHPNKFLLTLVTH